MKKKQAIFTIITSDYFQQAVVLGKSIKKFEPESDFVIFVVDYDEQDPDYKASGFSILDGRTLYPRKNWEQFAFQYNGLALCCSLKPRALLFLLNDYEKVICLDGDTKLFNSLEAAWKSLEHASLSLTPHNNRPIKNDEFLPPYMDLRLSGLFNSGYVGASESAKDFLEWWWEQLHYNCIYEPMIGIFNEQAYLNEAVILVKNLFILREETYNVSRWNLHERKVEHDGDHYTVNGVPLVLFHFSAPDNLANIRISTQKNDPFLDLYACYEKELVIEKTALVPKHYHYSHFQDGTVISPEWREWMRRGIPELEEKKNPFKLTREERTIIEKMMAGRPKNFQPNKTREINDWKNSFLAGTPTVKKLLSDLHNKDEKMKALEWKVAFFEASLPHRLLSKTIAFVKGVISKTCFRSLVK